MSNRFSKIICYLIIPILFRPSEPDTFSPFCLGCLFHFEGDIFQMLLPFIGYPVNCLV